MSTTTHHTSVQNLDELDRQIKQAEMIRQYLQVTNIDRNSLPIKQLSVPESETFPRSSTTVLPLSSFDFNELRRDVKLAEERVERLREELKELQSKRDGASLKAPPPYAPAKPNSEYPNCNPSTLDTRGILDGSTPPLVLELLLAQQQQRSALNNGPSPTLLPSGFNPVRLSPPIQGGVSAAVGFDVPKDHRHRQFFLTMHEHREQLVVYLDSLKQALSSLERLASLEPTRNEIQLANMKLDTIQQKSRQLRALKSSRSSQQSPFIECRIRQLEHDLVYMLSEHQKDVQTKLELNEQRSLMLLKIMQVTDELAAVDQQIQQLMSSTASTTDINLRTSSPLSNELNQPQASPSLRVINPVNNLDGRRVQYREPIDHNPLSKVSNPYYHQY